MTMGHVQFTLHNSLARWEWTPFPIAVLVLVVLVGYWYLKSDWRLASSGRRWSTKRLVSFLLGLLTVDLALQSPIATYTDSYFQAHVIQHLLLMVVAPALLALGAPSTLLLQTSSRSIKTKWLSILRSRPFGFISHPVTVWGLYFGFMIVFFLTSLVNFAMEHMAVMDLINILFFFSGTLYWWPLVGIDPIVHWKMGYPGRMLNVLLGGPVETWLGIAIISMHRPIASMYNLYGTHAGGSILWIATDFTAFVGFFPIFVQWFRSEERHAKRLDEIASRVQSPQDQRNSGETLEPKDPKDASSYWEQVWLERTGKVPKNNSV